MNNFGFYSHLFLFRAAGIISSSSESSLYRMPLFPLGLDDLELGLGFDDLDLVAVCLPVGCDFLLELGGLNNSSSLSSEILIWSSSSDSDLKNKIILCMLGNFSCFCCHLPTFSKINFFKKSFRNTIRVSNNLNPDQDQHLSMSVLIWVQTACKDYQQTKSCY